MNSIIQNKFKLKQEERFTLLVLMIISAALRIHTNFSTEYIPGNNGAFYLVMIRDLIEKGNLVMKDFPLLFWLEAAIAFVTYKLGIAGMNSSIDMTSRLFDSIIPVFCIIPAHLLIKKILTDKKDFIAALIFSSISILYFSFLILISDFQKNSLGILWLFWLLYFLLRIHEEPKTKNYMLAFLFFILSGLTHYGCFAAAVTIVVLDILVRYALRFNIKKLFKALFVSILIVSVGITLVFVINKWRALNFINIPIEIFAHPIIIPLLKGKPVLSPFEVINLLSVNLVALASFVVYIKNFKNLNSSLKAFILSMILLSLFLSSPFLSIDAALRLYFISYVTALPLVPFLYLFLNSKRNKSVYLALIVFIVLFSVISVKGKNQQSNMNQNIYIEMEKLKNIIPNDPRTIVIARHGMEYWSMWILRVDAVRQEGLTLNYWKWYRNIYFLRQKKEMSQFGPAGLYGPSYPQPAIPDKAYLVYSTEHFDLYRSAVPPSDFTIFQTSR